MRVVLFCALFLASCGQPPVAPEASTDPPTSTHASQAWDRSLMVLMPQIDRCIADSPDTRQVSYAGEHDRSTLVRLQGDEKAVDCRLSNVSIQARNTNVLVVDIRPRDADLVIDGESAAIFVRAPGENPGGECYEAPEVRAADGTLLGWMLDPDGC